MTEDSEFLDWLVTGYRASDLRWDHEDYESEALRHYKKNYVVYLVWLDDTKPRGVDFILCKNHPFWGRGKYCVLPCKSKEDAGKLWEVLLARMGWLASALSPWP